MSNDALSKIIQDGRQVLVACLSMKDRRSLEIAVNEWSKRAYAYFIENGLHTRAAGDVYWRDEDIWAESTSELIDRIRRWFEEAISTLESIQNPRRQAVTVTASNRNVFLIYGHNEALRVKVREFLTRLKFAPIDIGEMAGGGLKSILEKFRENADTAGFAVALLTDDDIGGKKGGEQKPRGRQNVLLEIGYFIGKLGAEKICVIYEDGVETPSDLVGQSYLLQGEWKLPLCDELEKAGYDVDRNLLKNA
jgi:predicted nucleotide-binding protein